MLWWLAHNTVTASVLALAVLLVCRFWSFRPSIRHALWLVVLLKLVAPPLVAWPWNPLEALGLTKTETPTGPVEFAEVKVVNLVDVPMTDGQLAAYLLATSKTQAMDETPAEVGIASEPVSRLGFVQPVLLSLWVIGAICMLSVQVIRAGRFRRLMRGWRPAPRKLRKQVDRLARQMKQRSPRLLLLPGLHSPFIWSLLRPWLLWPAALDEHLSPESHRTVIVHELAHLRRRDHWIGWLQLAGECIFWWNPLFWFVRRQIRFQAELACDAWVMRLLPEAQRAYAEALIEVTALISRAPTPIPALGMSGAARQDFERRLTMIMSDKVPDKAPMLGLAAIALMALAVLPAFSQDVKNLADPSKTDVILNVDALVKDSNQAKIDSLIVELDSLISSINADQDENVNKGNAPVQGNKGTQKATAGDEVKLVDAIRLAYADALLLKEADDGQPEKTREEKIKQIEKNLQELLKEVQSLKSNAATSGNSKSPKIAVDFTQPLILRVPEVSQAKSGHAVKITGQAKEAPSGTVTFQLVSPKDGQNFIIATDEKKAEAPKHGETKAYTIRLDQEAGKAKPTLARVIADGKSGQSKEMRVTVTKSADGQFLNINGKVVPLPKAGESKTITIDATHAGGQSKPATLKVIESKDGKLMFEGNLNIQEEGKGKVYFFENVEKKEPAEKGAQPQVMKIISQPAQVEGKPIVLNVEGGNFSMHGKDGKPFVIQMDTPKVIPDKKTITFTTNFAPGAKQEPKKEAGLAAPKKEIFLEMKDANFSQWPKQFQAWTVVESGAKTVVLNRTTYKLPKDRAAAVAAFLKDNVKGTVLETKVDGDSLTVTASPEVHKAIDSLLGLMHGKSNAGTGIKVQPKEFKYEIKVVPDGKNTSFQIVPDGKNSSFEIVPDGKNTSFNTTKPGTVWQTQATELWTNKTNWNFTAPTANVNYMSVLPAKSKEKTESGKQ